MKVDTEELYRQINSDLARVQRVLDDGMFPQTRQENLCERDELRRVKTGLLLIEEYVRRQPLNGGGSQC